ncbi:hypothetical protein [Glycomyces harbinensis]|uniref:Uncharacterized protein n=1 Tax=Glycomyces harbinensis TaxID=58114 RepID=A0A1G6R3Z0_9ACTN|nr:hypothetical protein [Glycomyces harbinensis]SDC99238.1 hypothetical protein SAMN05216270_101278 [Glycomyces harbinensis]
MAEVPPQPPRPQGANLHRASVFIVPLTMYLTALSLFATAIGLLMSQADINGALEEVLLGDPSFADADWASGNIAGVIAFSLKITAVLYLVFAALHLVLGPLNYKDKRWARILGWVLAGVSLGWCGIGGLLLRKGVTSASFFGESYNNQISNALIEATPAWLTALQVISWTLLIVGSALVIVLLAVQDSKERPRAEAPAYSPYVEPPQD